MTETESKLTTALQKYYKHIMSDNYMSYSEGYNFFIDSLVNFGIVRRGKDYVGFEIIDEEKAILFKLKWT